MNANNFSIKILVNDNDLLPPYNHVHHAQILNYLEQARVAWIASIGYPMEYWFNSGVVPVVRAISIEYLREVKAGESLVSCDCLEIARKNLNLYQRIINSKGKDAVIAEVSLMFLDLKSGRSVVLDSNLSQRVLSENTSTSKP